jgi:FkbM family methyltransferase
MGIRSVLLGGEPVQVHDKELHKAFWDLVDAGRWEPATLAAIAHLVAGSVYIDIGAWIGPTVIAAARRADLVVAFEPDPVAAAELRENIRLNDLRNVVVHEVALYNSNGRAPLALGLGDVLGWSTSSLVFGPPASLDVDVRDAKDEATSDAFQRCTLLKIDVEGAEYVLIGRFRRYLRDRRPKLLLSLHSFQWRKREYSELPSGVARMCRRLGNAAQRATLIWRTRHYSHIYLEGESGWLELSRLRRWALVADMRDQAVLLSDEQFDGA